MAASELGDGGARSAAMAGSGVGRERERVGGRARAGEQRGSRCSPLHASQRAAWLGPARHMASTRRQGSASGRHYSESETPIQLQVSRLTGAFQCYIVPKP